MNKANRPKRQHLLPRFYLENFSENAQAWVVDFHSDKLPYLTNIENILCVSDFYTVETRNDPKDVGIEREFSRVEGEAKPVIDRIRNDMVLPQKKDKAKLAVFLASLYVRSPRVRQMQLELFESIIKSLLQRDLFFKNIYPKYASGTENPLDEETCKKLLDECNVEGHISNEGYIKAMLRLWPTISAVFNHMTWSIYWAAPLKPARFVTGDFPFVIENKQNHEFEFPQGLFANKYIKVFFPLSPFVCLAMEYNGEQDIYPIIFPEIIPIMNSQIAVHSQRCVVSKNKNIYWYKDGNIYDSIELLHKEFFPDKINETFTEVSNLQGHYEKSKPRTSWNKLRGDKPKNI